MAVCKWLYIANIGTKANTVVAVDKINNNDVTEHEKIGHM